LQKGVKKQFEKHIKEHDENYSLYLFISLLKPVMLVCIFELLHNTQNGKPNILPDAG